MAGHRWRSLALAAVCGALLAGTLAPYSVWLLALPALIGVAWLFVQAETTRQATLLGWVFGTVYFGCALIWIVEPFLVDVARHGWMAPFALIFMAGGLALFWAVAFGVAHRFKGPPLVGLLALILTWSLAEFARAYVLTGFPWAALGQIWVETRAIAVLAWVGPHGLAVMTLVGLVPVALVMRPGLSWTARALTLVPGGVMVAAVLLVDAASPKVAMTDKIVRLIQPNAPQHQKWHPDHVWQFFERQLDYTSAETGQPRPDLIVWPETSVPPYLDTARPQLAAMAAAADGVAMAFGIRRADGLRRYNALAFMDENGVVAGTYDKHHLVPFGEYIPLGALAARFGIQGMAVTEGNGFSAGPGPQVMDFGGLGHAVPLICYEAVFPQEATNGVSRGDFLLQITNDAWFGQFSGPYQHLAQARMRAVEQGLPMIRVANTGISAMIDPRGEIVDSLPLNSAGFLDVALPAPLPPTYYFRTGDWPAFLLVIVLYIVLIALHFRYRHSKPH